MGFFNLNFIANILSFFPLGFLLPIVFWKAKGLHCLLGVFATSLIFEVVQLITNFGSFDVDDIILNLMGGIIGFLIFKAFTFSVNKCKILIVQ